MKDIFEKFEEQAKKVSLSSEEKQKIRGQLIVFTETNQATNQVTKLSSREVGKISKSRIFFQHLFILKLHPMFIALMIALVLGGGTAFAAENALPGDTLYPVKIHVNEQVRDALEISAEKQAEWDLKKAERRLVEVQKLAQKGVLNANVKADLSNRIDLLLSRVEDRDEADDRSSVLRVNLQALVRAHSGIFDSLATTTVTGTSRIELKALLDALKTKHYKSTTSTATSTRDADFENAALGKQRAAEHKLAEVEAYIERKFAGFGSTSTVNTTSPVVTSLKTRVQTKLQEAKNFITQGNTAFDQGMYYKAFTSFTLSMGAAQEAKILVATARELKINLHNGRDDRNTTSTDSRRQNDDADKKEDKDDDREKEDDSRGRSDIRRNNGESRGRGRD